jgi:hypothetical protein
LKPGAFKLRVKPNQLVQSHLVQLREERLEALAGLVLRVVGVAQPLHGGDGHAAVEHAGSERAPVAMVTQKHQFYRIDVWG